MKSISIRQPGYMPYLGFFKKIQSVDIFVFLDDVKYSRSDWDNRNKIRTSEGSMWLTVPVLNKPEKFLNEVQIDYSKNWIYKHKTAIIHNYEKCPYFESYWKDIEKLLDFSYPKLIELNLSLIKYFISALKINTETVLSSELNCRKSGSSKLLDICQFHKCDTYISGELGKNYLDEKIFFKNNIRIIYEKFEPYEYTQRFNTFIKNLSIIDLLFNEGENSIKILEMSKNFTF